MRTRRHLSLVVALLVAVASVAPLAVESRGADMSAATVVAAYDGTRADARPKGNGFVRAITAPFRALGRLFGGGRKDQQAKRRKPAAERRQQTAQHTPEPPQTQPAAAPAQTTQVTEAAQKTPAAPAAPESAVAAEASEVVSSAAVAVTEVAPSPAVAQAVRSADNVRVVRLAEGEAVAPTTPRWVPVIEGIAKDPLTQGRALLEHGYPNEAVSELSVAATIGPDLVEANKLLGVALDRLGNHPQAIEAYERALTLAPDNAEVLNNYGYSLFIEGRTLDALARLRQAERLTPGASYVLANIAVVQAKLGKYGDAFKSFRRAYGEYEARIKTAELLEEAGRDDDALKHYEAARALQPGSPALLERLAAHYERKGRARDAEAARRAIGNPPNKQKTATGGGG